MSSMDDERRDRYYIEAGAEDKRLTDCLAAIRAREDAKSISTREAADQRIAAMEQHLDAVRELRRKHFGDGDEQ
jgi:hypothetical protein